MDKNRKLLIALGAAAVLASSAGAMNQLPENQGVTSPMMQNAIIADMTDGEVPANIRTAVNAFPDRIERLKARLLKAIQELGAAGIVEELNQFVELLDQTIQLGNAKIRVTAQLWEDICPRIDALQAQIADLYLQTADSQVQRVNLLAQSADLILQRLNIGGVRDRLRHRLNVISVQLFKLAVKELELVNRITSSDCQRAAKIILVDAIIRAEEITRGYSGFNNSSQL